MVLGCFVFRTKRLNVLRQDNNAYPALGQHLISHGGVLVLSMRIEREVRAADPRFVTHYY
jgi:hypothetical protein